MNDIQKQWHLFQALKAYAFDDEFSNNRIFSAIFRGLETGWWTSHITKQALKEYVECDFGKAKVVRAHVIDRVKTMRELLASDEEFTPESLAEFMRMRNRCVLATRFENSNNHFSELIALPADLFPSANVGFKFRKGVEGEALKQLAKEHGLI